MRSEYLNLKKIIDLEKWQKLQDALAQVTKMAIITVDYKGIPVTKHSYCQNFCNFVRKDPKLASYCQKCDARGGLEAVRLNKPYIYLCYFNIVDIAIPIIVDDKYVGAIMAGQVRLSNKKDESSLEQILSVPNSTLKSKFKKISKIYSNIPNLSFTEVKNTADMLFQLCNYIVEEALNKSLLIEIYEETISENTNSDIASKLQSYKAKNIENIKNELSNAMINSHIKDLSFKKTTIYNPLLEPAFEYIYSHKSENISLKQVADLCHLSPSYFSKIFTRETGNNFSTYLSLLKIEWAKQLLESTNMTVLQISDELGFKESGYFIKTFKKFEGITPLIYRKYYKDSLMINQDN
ncbi:MAG: PocR ligand-binding domain-containing protein [Spirochaetales bacterium]|nr:PocR ligand-binding domain-containing protein [Spirochaetales bacterium]